MTNNINHIKWIKNEWKSHKAYVFILLFLTLLSTAVAVAYPFLFRQLIDSLEKSLSTPGQINPMSPVHKIVLIMLIVGFVRVISSFYPGFRAYMNLLFEYVLRHRYFKYIIEKDYRFFLKFRTGDLVTRLTNDIQDFPKIGWFLCSGIFRAFDSFIKILFCLVVMFLLSWKLTLLAMLPIPFMIAVFYIVSNKLHKSFEKNQEAISEINNQLEMTFSGIKIIKAFVCEEKYKRFFSKALDNRFITELRLVKINTVLHLVYEYIDYFSMISIILFGGYMVVKGEITIGTFYAFYTYLSMLIYPILDLPQLFVSGR
ncbi:MAG: ABC transporter transmembrane domain-containing protein, partial [Candidatus Cloacimonetes bacterium]|nr:ABC transporter transmembrane domain-containing protein [Candidatus Cloacimonadota bacterium]